MVCIEGLGRCSSVCAATRKTTGNNAIYDLSCLSEQVPVPVLEMQGQDCFLQFVQKCWQLMYSIACQQPMCI